MICTMRGKEKQAKGKRETGKEKKRNDVHVMPGEFTLLGKDPYPVKLPFSQSRLLLSLAEFKGFCSTKHLM